MNDITVVDFHNACARLLRNMKIAKNDIKYVKKAMKQVKRNSKHDWEQINTNLQQIIVNNDWLLQDGDQQQATSTSSQNDFNEAFAECPRCDKEMRTAYAGPCGHTMCHTCIKPFKKGGKCPTCQKNFTKPAKFHMPPLRTRTEKLASQAEFNRNTSEQEKPKGNKNFKRSITYQCNLK
jgi:hypothetical protein